MNRELQLNIEVLFGPDFANLKDELTEIYNLIRMKMRDIYTHGRSTTWKVCDKCGCTYPRLTEQCVYDHTELRAFEVPFDNKFLEVDIFHKGNVRP